MKINEAAEKTTPKKQEELLAPEVEQFVHICFDLQPNLSFKHSSWAECFNFLESEEAGLALTSFSSRKDWRETMLRRCINVIHIKKEVRKYLVDAWGWLYDREGVALTTVSSKPSKRVAYPRGSAKDIEEFHAEIKGIIGGHASRHRGHANRSQIQMWMASRRQLSIQTPSRQSVEPCDRTFGAVAALSVGGRDQ